MLLVYEVIYGKLVEKNALPPDVTRAFVHVSGEYNDIKHSFGITEGIINKYVLLVGDMGN